jgi:Fe(3+) dicitrate transport protein
MVQRIIHKHSLLAWAVLSTLTSNSSVLHQLYAAELNTNVPTTSETGGFPVQINLPAQPLNQSIRQLANQTGLSISFDSELTKNKTAPAVKGFLSPQEALKKILQGSGLQLNISGDSAVIKPEPEKSPQALNLDAVEVRAKRFYEVGPLPGLGLTKEQIPGNVQSISAKEIKEAHSLSLADLMNRKLQSVTVNDYQGNPFQMDVQYRGFTAGPQIGTPQGLSVFFDGIRVNEPFGDVVNWDMIPMNAIANLDVFPGSNPIFGLNTLGGAFTLKTKDGFNHSGVDADVLTGSFGRKQLQAEGGWNNGTVGLFAAGNFFLEDGWRQNSPSKVNQLFTKASFRGEKIDLNLSTLLVQTDLVGNGLLPSQMYEQDRNSVFTSPDKTENQLAQFQLSGSYFVNDTFTVTGQVYRRNSKRHQVGSDVVREWNDNFLGKRTPAAGEEFTCLLASTGSQKGIPDMYVIPSPADPSNGSTDITSTDFYQNLSDNVGNTGVYTVDQAQFANLKNTGIPDDMAQALRDTFNFWKNKEERILYNQNQATPKYSGSAFIDSNGNQITDGNGQPLSSYYIGGSLQGDFQPLGSGDTVYYPNLDDVYFYKYVNVNGVDTLYRFNVVLLAPTNNDKCSAARDAESAYPFQPIDGANGNGPGVVEGTPTAIINDNNINQLVDGASIQLNWNLEHHKFMVGASIDSASADYSNYTQLGFFDAERNAYIDPAQAHPQFIGAYQQIPNNNFSGTNTTQSIYFSETWTPVETLHFNVSGRYNQTFTKNKIAARYGYSTYEITDLIGYPDRVGVCDGDCTTNKPPTYYRPINLFNALDPAETEKFSFYSFNPSLGATWQATDQINIFANVAQGTRVPSVIELGCAFDNTPVLVAGRSIPKSLAENRQCTLPTALSGDPFLPQIRSTSYDLGLRGNWGEGVRWNVGAFQTDLRDDIYFVAVGNGRGFFNTIGDTRRRGIEMGLAGQKDKWNFNVNYALTDATFEDSFRMISPDNSSSTDKNDGYGQAIDVKPGSRIPGVSLHNLNASVNYAVSNKWTVGLSAVAHSDSYVRGNENNEHKVGVIQDRGMGAAGNALLRPTSNPGTVPGFAVFNFQTSYKLSKEWTATMIVNNLFDREYFTAGRLGRNPFSPSINGAIGPDGYNHNSNDWLSTNFISPGAPRGIWFSLNWHFVPD